MQIQQFYLPSQLSIKLKSYFDLKVTKHISTTKTSFYIAIRLKKCISQHTIKESHAKHKRTLSLASLIVRNLSSCVPGVDNLPFRRLIFLRLGVSCEKRGAHIHNALMDVMLWRRIRCKEHQILNNLVTCPKRQREQYICRQGAFPALTSPQKEVLSRKAPACSRT